MRLNRLILLRELVTEFLLELEQDAKKTQELATGPLCFDAHCCRHANHIGAHLDSFGKYYDIENGERKYVP